MYKRVELKEGTPIQYLAVYVTKWLREWGQPDVGFVEVEESWTEETCPHCGKKFEVHSAHYVE